MTDETTTEATETPDDGGAVAVEDHPPALRTEPDPDRPTWWNQFLSPLLIPIACVGGIVFFVLNFSRMFLAGEGSLAVVFGTLITVGILVVSAILANSRMKGSSLAVVLVGLAATVGIFGMLSIGDAEPEKEAAVTECTPSTGELDVTAGPGLKYDKTAYTVKAGCVEVVYRDMDSAHNFTWDPGGPKMPVLAKDGEKFATDMVPGKYVFYCSVSGHRAGGMEATVTVTG